MPANSPPESSTETSPEASSNAALEASQETAPEMQPASPTSLYFEYANTAPDLDALDVKTVHPDELLGRPAVFTVIGESHYVGLPSLGFHELCSCKPLSSEESYETPLGAGVEQTFQFTGDALEATTTVAGRPLDAFPGHQEATVAYRFGPEAWTTIHVADAGYETYHTYPEHDLALYTETRLTELGSPDAEPTAEESTDVYP